jgi:hypothetical protein
MLSRDFRVVIRGSSATSRDNHSAPARVFIPQGKKRIEPTGQPGTKRGDAMMNHPVVGKCVDSWCSRCKLMLAHTIEAIVNGKITRTHCNTCHAQHAYRPNQPGTSSARPRGDSPPRAKSAKAGASAADYQTLLQKVDASTARRYSTSERFREKEIIDHPTFGIGLVVAVRDTNKIDVGFTDGMRTLTHGASA